MEIIFSIKQINEVAKKILDENPKKIILFNGLMGAGKTTLINAISQQLGVLSTTSSPTFSLVNEYPIDSSECVYHFDFYRLKNEFEALDMGAEEYFYSNNWCFIEWSEKIPNLIPNEHSVITIEVLQDGNRKLYFEK